MPQLARIALGALAAAALLGLGGACPSNTPAGENGTGPRVRCTTTADCPEPTVCLFGSAGGRCAMPGSAPMGGECSAARDCAEGLYCTAAGRCGPAGTKRDGEGCSTDGDCQSGRRCIYDGFTGHCGAGGSSDVGGACASHVDCLSGLWCAANGQCQSIGKALPPWPGASCSDEGPYRSYFEVPRPGKPPADFFRLPFPNDIRVRGGVLDMSDFPRPGPTPLGVDLVQLYVDSWVADFDGFGTSGSVTFRFSAGFNWDAAANGDNVRLADVTAGVDEELGREWQYGGGAIKYACGNRFTINAQRTRPLIGGHVYAAFLTTAITSEAAGAAPVQDPDLAAVLAPAAPAGDPALADAWTVYAPFRRFLAASGIAPASIANAAVFTVQDAPGHMQRLARSVAGTPAPVLTELTVCDAGVTSPCDVPAAVPGRLACPAASAAFHEIHGKMTVPIYQQGTLPYDKPADGGGIRETGGVPQLVRTDEICFALTVPKAAAPASGWPLVVYHHGTGGSMRSFIDEGIAGLLAGAPLPAAALSFEGVEHGARRGGSQKKPDDLVFNPLNPRAARDNFLQGAVDILQALRVAGVTVDAPPAVTGVRFDAAKVLFFGHSQGSTSGELAMAFATGVETTVLSGAGAYLTASLLEKTSPIDVSSGMEFLIGEHLFDQHPVMTIFQSFFERSDPLNYAPLLVRASPAGVPSKHVFMSWGTGDTYTPEQTLRANAQALAILPVAPLLAPVIGNDTVPRPVTLSAMGGDNKRRTAAVFQYAPSGYDGHFVIQRHPQAQSDWMAFVQSYLATGTPAVP